MSDDLKQQLLAKLEPLYDAIDAAIVRGDAVSALLIAIDMLEVIGSYSDKLSRDEIREVANNPKANAIAERLGVKPSS